MDLSWHLSPAGLSGELLEDFLRAAGVSARFLGAKTEDELLTPATAATLEKKEGEEKGRGGRGFTVLLHVYGAHWAMVYFELGEYAIYVDSYGLPASAKLRHFLRSTCRVGEESIWHNGRQIQAYSSNYCGLFAALFVLHYDRHQRHLPAGRFVWSRKNLDSNNERCYRYLKKMVGL